MVFNKYRKLVLIMRKKYFLAEVGYLWFPETLGAATYICRL